jgi:hypothetical protein
MVAIAQVELIFSNIKVPRCVMAAAMTDGLRNAATAEAAKFGSLCSYC